MFQMHIMWDGFFFLCMFFSYQLDSFVRLQRYVHANDDKSEMWTMFVARFVWLLPHDNATIYTITIFIVAPKCPMWLINQSPN